MRLLLIFGLFMSPEAQAVFTALVRRVFIRRANLALLVVTFLGVLLFSLGRRFFLGSSGVEMGGLAVELVDEIQAERHSDDDLAVLERVLKNPTKILSLEELSAVLRLALWNDNLGAQRFLRQYNLYGYAHYLLRKPGDVGITEFLALVKIHQNLILRDLNGRADAYLLAWYLYEMQKSSSELVTVILKTGKPIRCLLGEVAEGSAGNVSITCRIYTGKHPVMEGKGVLAHPTIQQIPFEQVREVWFNGGNLYMNTREGIYLRIGTSDLILLE